eukprot:TRINITY_DN8812_c0_g2_i1.p1 TRINITY_DN8812_c0_g2~~TRINITY_DN8812_c0_g2_i1.p1  ORF type:complete len:1563 (+),score=433.81 TRINITY_DN8812_c0_g2_i1:1176-5864(+)
MKQLPAARSRTVEWQLPLLSAEPPDACAWLCAAFVYCYDVKRPGGAAAPRQIGTEIASAQAAAPSEGSECVLRLARPLTVRLDAFVAHVGRQPRPGTAPPLGVCCRHTAGQLCSPYPAGGAFAWGGLSSCYAPVEEAVPPKLLRGGTVFLLRPQGAATVSFAKVAPSEGEALLPAGYVGRSGVRVAAALRCALAVPSEVCVICDPCSLSPLDPRAAVDLRLQALQQTLVLYRDFVAEYVEPSVVDAAAPCADGGTRLFSFFDDWLTAPQEWSLLISGEGGAGKSSAALALSQRVLRQRAERGAGPLPVFLSFAEPAMRRKHSGAFWDGSMSHLLAQSLQLSGAEELAELQSRSLLLIWDSLDEAGGRLPVHLAEPLLQLGGVGAGAFPRAKHVISCRCEWLQQHRVARRQLCGDGGWAHVRVLGLDQRAADEYIRRVCAKEVRQLRHRLQAAAHRQGAFPKGQSSAAGGVSASSAARPFPESLGPFGTAKCDAVPLADLKSGSWRMKQQGVALTLSRARVSCGGRLSPASELTLDRSTRRQLGIPGAARTFCFAYPTDARTEEWAAVPEAEKQRVIADPVGSLVLFGGYLYFDQSGLCVAARCLCPGTALRFDGPYFVGREQQRELLRKLLESRRFEPVTIEDLRQVGAQYFAWLLPGEHLGGGRDCDHGGFLYLFHGLSEPQPDARYFTLSGDDPAPPKDRRSPPRTSPGQSALRPAASGAGAGGAKGFRLVTAASDGQGAVQSLARDERMAGLAVAAMRCSPPPSLELASLRAEIAFGGVLLDLPANQHNPGGPPCGWGSARMAADGWQPGSPRRIPGRRGAPGRTLPQMYLFDLGCYRKVLGVAIRGGRCDGRAAYPEMLRVYTGATTLPTCSAVAPIRNDAHMPLLRTGLDAESCDSLALLPLAAPADTRYVALVDPRRSDAGPVLLRAAPVVAPLRGEGAVQQCLQAVQRQTAAVVRGTFGSGRVGTWPLYIAVEAAGAGEAAGASGGLEVPRAALFRRWMEFTLQDRLEEAQTLRRLLPPRAERVALLYKLAKKLAVALFKRQEWRGPAADYLRLIRSGGGRLAAECGEELLRALPLRLIDADPPQLCWRHRSVAEFLVTESMLEYVAKHSVLPDWFGDADFPLSASPFLTDHPALTMLSGKLQLYNAAVRACGETALSVRPPAGGDEGPASLPCLWSRRSVSLAPQRVRRLRGHTDKVRCVAGTRDLGRFASGGYDGLVILWDGATAEPVARLEGHSCSVSSVAVAYGGERTAQAARRRAAKLPDVVSGSWDCSVILWDSASGQRLRQLNGHSNWVRCVAATAGMDTVLSGSHDTTIIVWDAATGERRHTLRGHTETVTCLAVAADGSRAVSGSSDSTLIVWDLRHATAAVRAKLVGHEDEVTCLSANPQVTQVVSSAMDYQIIVWNCDSGARARTLTGTHSGFIRGVACDKHMTRAVTCASDGNVVLWDLATGAVLQVLHGHDEAVFGVAAADNAASLVTASFDHTLSIWFLPHAAVRLQPMAPGDLAAAQGFVRVGTGGLQGAVPPGGLCHSEHPGTVAYNALTLLGVSPRGD